MIVKTTRKIFSPVVRSGESVPRAVIPVDVEDLDDVSPSVDHISHRSHSKISKTKSEKKNDKGKQDLNPRSKSSGDLQESEEQRPRSRPPLPLSPSSQRKPQPKETAPSIRIMIQRYNMKINEEGKKLWIMSSDKVDGVVLPTKRSHVQPKQETSAHHLYHPTRV